MRPGRGDKCTFKRPRLVWDGNIKMDRLWTGFSWLRIGSIVGSCEHGNDTLG
jgi:hypothetical protein